MAESDKAFKGAANLSLWFKIRSGDELKLSDIPELIPLRWSYFRNNWEFIKPDIQSKVADYSDPDFLTEQIDKFSDFITRQRTISKNINPFSDGVIFNRYYAIFDNVTIESINLTNEEQRIVDAK